jgi:hypothetical protein
MRQPTTLLLAAALLATGACASAGTAADGTPRAARTASSTNLLGPAEIEAAAQRNMRDVITALRPRWLQNANARDFDPRSASEAIEVYVNGRPSGGLDALSGIDKSAVDRVHYYTLSEAQGRYGSVVRGPIIDVRLKVGG